MARLPNNWLHYDGMQNPKMELFPLNRDGATAAMKGRGIAHIYYEVLHAVEFYRFGEEELDHSTVFQYKTAGEKKKTVEKKDKTIKKENKVREVNSIETLEEENEWKDEDKVVGYSLRKSQGKAHIPPPTASRKSQGKPRIPPGWSVRSEGSGARGPLATCRGCRGKIRRDAKCLRHGYRKQTSHLFQTVDMYHCRVSCLEKVKKSELKKLIQKHWTDSRVTTVAEKLDKKLRLSL